MPYGTGLAKGFALTFRKMLSRPITIQYPDVRYQVPERSRGELHLRRWEDGSLKCVACRLCSRACPDCLIDILTTKDEDGGQTLDGWHWESYACMFCGLCVDACPWDALEQVGTYELATYKVERTWRTLAAGEPADSIPHHRAVAKAKEEAEAQDAGGDGGTGAVAVAEAAGEASSGEDGDPE